MKRIAAILFVFIILSLISSGQNGGQKVFTSDIANFWTAYDSCQTTKDSLKKLHFIQTLYIDKGTKGLAAFMKARKYTPELWVSLINKYPKFWNSVRPNTLSAKSKAKEIETSIKKLKELYPNLKEAKMYFTIGGLRSGGTTMNDMVLIGTEIATATASTVAPNSWLAGVFKEQKINNIIPLNIHEYVHTQQNGEPQNLLAASIQEGSCDFITELVMGAPLQNNYLQYGRTYETELKEQFKQEMFTTSYFNWLYNGSNAKTVADLGYFMGYTICKAYYTQSANKKTAIKDIIELNYSDTVAVGNFLKKAKYYQEPLDKKQLTKQFEEKRPFIIRLEPFSNGDSLIDASTKVLTFIFSEPMKKEGVSINLTERGKEFYPIVSVVGYSEDGTSFTVKLDMKPNHDYEFVVTGLAFQSEKGYPLKSYDVKFKTK